jgi:hypothetical protein
VRIRNDNTELVMFAGRTGPLVNWYVLYRLVPFCQLEYRSEVPQCIDAFERFPARPLFMI